MVVTVATAATVVVVVVSAALFTRRYLKVKPKRGAALAFWSYHPNGVLDLRAFHGGCPVKAGGVKWMGQQWVLGVPFDKSEWHGDNFRKSRYKESWFEQFAQRDVQQRHLFRREAEGTEAP